MNSVNGFVKSNKYFSWIELGGDVYVHASVINGVIHS